MTDEEQKLWDEFKQFIREVAQNPSLRPLVNERKEKVIEDVYAVRRAERARIMKEILNDNEEAKAVDWGSPSGEEPRSQRRKRLEGPEA